MGRAPFGRLFGVLVLGWIILVGVGLIWRLPYVGRDYAGITLPLYGGGMLLVLGLATVQAGVLWRGRHAPVERVSAPTVFWGAVGLMFAVAAVLLGMGVYHVWHHP
jgi:hypothetical protein